MSDKLHDVLILMRRHLQEVGGEGDELVGWIHSQRKIRLRDI